MGGTVQTLPNEELKSSSHSSLSTHSANLKFELAITTNAIEIFAVQKNSDLFFWRARF
jgi:hypothetical protein